MKKIMAGVMLAAVLGTAAAGTVFAASPDELITTRQAEMKANTKAMKALVSILKGETPYDNAGVQAAAKMIKDAHAEGVAKDVWNASAQQGTSVKTEAKPEIWTDSAGFAAAWKNLDTAVAALEASKDQASFKAAVPALGAACKGCHEKFRAAE